MSLGKDLAFGLRKLRRRPGFTLTAAASLAIGIGAATTVFSLINGLLLKPLPGVEQVEELVNVYRVPPSSNSVEDLSYPEFEDLQETVDGFSSLASFTDRAVSLSTGGEPELVLGQMVSGNYFEVLGTQPAAGRFFRLEEDGAPGAHPVAVLSHTLWQRRFGGDPSVVGRQVSLNGVPFTVIGVASKGFGGMFIGFVFDLWVPNAMAQTIDPTADLEERGDGLVEVVGRLAPGTTFEQVEAEMDAVARRLEQQYPEFHEGHGFKLSPVTGYDEGLRGAVVGFTAVLMGVALLVLLTAGVNLANLQLARAADRGRELAIRQAVGAGRRQLFGQLLMENLLLTLLGGLGGIGLAIVSTRLLRAFEPPLSLPLVFDFDVDGRILLFALLLSLLAGLVFGLGPALKASRTRLVNALRDRGQEGGGGSRLRGVFVSLQVAVCLLLLIVAGLLLRALSHATNLDPGFQVEGVQVVSVAPSVLGIEASGAENLYRRLADRIEAIGGVESVSQVDMVPLGLGSVLGLSETPVLVEGQEPPEGQEGFPTAFSRVAPGYFETMEIPLVQGRDFTELDDEGRPGVVIVNQEFVRRFFEGQDVLGRRLLRRAEAFEIVGVARNSKYASAHEESLPFLYLPFAQSPTLRRSVLVRSSGSSAAMLPLLREAVRSTEPTLPILELRSLEDSIAISLLPQRLASTVAGSLGLIGLLLAIIGVYGIVAYSVRQRRRELGVRMALGARGRDVVGQVLARGLRLALVGVAFGIVVALLLTRFLTVLLKGVSPTDPLTFLLVPALLVLIALAASYLPARKAADLDPMTILRFE